MLLNRLHDPSAQHHTNMIELRNMLDVTLFQFESALGLLRTIVDLLWLSPPCALSMDYNRLKLLVLRTISERGATDSSAVAAALNVAGVGLDVHAIRMALMRYYRQGLLTRKRKFGLYIYDLSERGVRRLAWLESSARADSFEHKVE